MTVIANTVSIDSHGTAIQTALFSPAGASNGAAIMLVHGSDGTTEPWAASIREYAIDLPAMGFTALIPNYFEKTGTTPGLRLFSEPPANCIANRHSWEEAVSDTVAHAKTLPPTPVSRIGLLGFSLGGPDQRVRPERRLGGGDRAGGRHRGSRYHKATYSQPLVCILTVTLGLMTKVHDIMRSYAYSLLSDGADHSAKCFTEEDRP